MKPEAKGLLSFLICLSLLSVFQGTARGGEVVYLKDCESSGGAIAEAGDYFRLAMTIGPYSSSANAWEDAEYAVFQVWLEGEELASEGAPSVVDIDGGWYVASYHPTETLWAGEYFIYGEGYLDYGLDILGPYTAYCALTVEGSSSHSEPPEASFEYSPSEPGRGETVFFDASLSRDPDGEIVAYDWDFGDGSAARGKTVEHAYTSEGQYEIALTVTDDDDLTATRTKRIFVSHSHNEPPEASFEHSPSEPGRGETVFFDASLSRDPDGEIVAYDWDFGDGSAARGKTVEHVYETEGSFEVVLVVTDDEGSIAEKVRTIVVAQAEDPYDKEGDDSARSATTVVINPPFQSATPHNFHEPGDEDWFKFNGLSSEAYTISVIPLGERVDPVIELYDAKGETLLASGPDVFGTRLDDEPANGFSLTYAPPEDDIYTVRVRNRDPQEYGEGTSYHLGVTTRLAPTLSSTLEGVVLDAESRLPLVDVRVQTTLGMSSLTLPTGDYLMFHLAGDYTITAEAPGYLGFSRDFSIEEGEVLALNIDMTPSPAQEACQAGGTEAGETASAVIDTNLCPALILRLSRRPPSEVDARLYVTIQAPQLFPGMTWFRPSEATVEAAGGSYVQLGGTADGYLAGAESFYYVHERLSPQHGDEVFEVGTGGLSGTVIVAGTFYLQDGREFRPENLHTLQTVEVRFQ